MNETAASTEQAPTPSIEERAARIFGPSDETEAPQRTEGTEQPSEETEAAPSEPEQAETAEDLFEFEFDGTTYALPKPLERAVQNMRDYTQKTQSVASQRKQIELLQEQARVANMRTEFESEVSEHIKKLHTYDAVLQEQSKVNWAQMSTEDIMRHKLQLDSWKEERDALARDLNVRYQQWNDKRSKAVEELKAKANEIAGQRIPNWNEATQKAVREHALSEGYTEAELSQVGLDPRHWVTLWKAKQFDELKAKAAKTVTDVKTVKTTATKNPMPQTVKDKLNFRKAVAKTSPNSPERRRLVEQRAAQIFK